MSQENNSNTEPGTIDNQPEPNYIFIRLYLTEGELLNLLRSFGQGDAPQPQPQPQEQPQHTCCAYPDTLPNAVGCPICYETIPAGTELFKTCDGKQIMCSQCKHHPEGNGKCHHCRGRPCDCMMCVDCCRRTLTQS